MTVRPGLGHCSFPAPAALAGMLLVALFASLAGCSTQKTRDYTHYTAPGLYHEARKALEDNDYESAVKDYVALTSRFPFTPETRQARLDLICVYYRKGEKETATDAADQFLRENPTHPRVDYAWYMKGLIDSEETPWKIERWLGVDTAKRPPASLNSAITAFTTVVKQYPKSEYAPDAQLRLIYLRNRLAEYEINVAHYYLHRGAYVAAAARSQHLIEQYDGAPSVKDGLDIMIESYRKLGLTDLQTNVEQVYETNYQKTSAQNVRPKKWWHFW
ncbi:MAG TPA: outer membrane protein assembly factor BamD [Steroidobacteraceae bacterium]|nr:outer membrane protein assembly factor BamD [Steroidobacteraceae bacterium]